MGEKKKNLRETQICFQDYKYKLAWSELFTPCPEKDKGFAELGSVPLGTAIIATLRLYGSQYFLKRAS